MAQPNLIAAHIAVGLTGAVKLVKLDTRGFDYFGDTTEDFWRSFLAAGVIAPLFILYLVIRFIDGGAEAHGAFPIYLIAQMFAYAIAWLVFPLVMLHLAPLLQRDDKVIKYLVAYNWVSVIQNAVYLPVIILGMTETFTPAFGNLLALVALMWVLGLSLFVTRKALDVPFGTAAGIIVMDLLLGVLVEVLTGR